jgi:hypothetical protein
MYEICYCWLSSRHNILDVSLGITVSLIIGVLSNHIGESVLAALGTINVCIQVRNETKQTIMIRTLILASIINTSCSKSQADKS